ncbi:hypothetical protein EVAR_21920_1 [Eumeta japonica]|uniref:Uncharacterized protein n=1 Tax=Eumeta variegata TaxID=151549 RepID=A0A4C1XGK5_EUMVA|nr:hypothetical protein EVAR_21920_1 [Eumeta japonica]
MKNDNNFLFERLDTLIASLCDTGSPITGPDPPGQPSKRSRSLSRLHDKSARSKRGRRCGNIYKHAAAEIRFRDFSRVLEHVRKHVVPFESRNSRVRRRGAT